MENSIGQLPTMDTDYDQYAAFLSLLNMNVTYDPNYVVSHDVKVCNKSKVNNFGSAFNPIFYYVNFLLSYLGNGLVLYIIYKYEKLNTVTNIFLLNLVLSNILFATSLPFWATYHQSEWIFGNVLCKMVSSAYFIGFYSSILFLTLMTFDRYLAVVHAVAAAKSRRRSYAFISSIVVWCISVIASMKELVFQNVWESPFNGLVCEETGYAEATMAFWRLVTYYQQLLLFFLLPLLMVIYCYICITVRILSTRMKEKCRAIKLIFIIIFTFFICWTPYNIVILLLAINSPSPEVNCADSDKLDYALFVTQNIAYLYCCISPVFYTFLGKKFQSYFKRMLAKRIPCLRRHISLSSQSTRTTSQKTPHSDYEY
ncbi:C-C chemokine receptor type 5-like [Corythoichthys intestinalis]|uniref:C-C chemokine receptor type 5-like n=1 Tax=Corythoichthys intestinalis TaxID=161448 RepID=UPI0025A51F8B|nr:C-C chemokine receptor type 5-like [Corythoichthys intestinalis]XP_061795692.1 C-C chemokine receptor type 5-like [Nerophis lumbriciformis]